MMNSPLPLLDSPPLRGICLIVKGRRQAGAGFPGRPNARALSESIPLFFIARNHDGFWVAREAEGRTGGIFFLRRSALRFAETSSAATGCATMFLPQRLELDIPNRGPKITAWLIALIGRLGRLIPDHPPALRIRREILLGRDQ